MMVEEKKIKEETKMDKKMEEMIKSIESMSVLELSEFVKALEDKFGVSAAMPMMVAGAMPQAGAAGAEAAEEKTSFTVVITSAGPNKIAVIKEVRAVTS